MHGARDAARMTTAAPAAITREHEVARYLERGDLKSAQALCRSLNAEFPQFAPGGHGASVLALRLGEPASALALIEQALASAPGDARYLLQRAHCLRALRRLPDALACAADAERTARNDAVILDAVGTFYSFLGEQQSAHAAYCRAIAIDSECAQYWFNRAAVRRFLGHITDAEADYDRAIALRPEDYEAYINRSELRTQCRERNHIEELQRLLASAVRQWRGEVQVRYALAKELEDLGEHSRSWQQLAQGARLRREHLQYDIARDLATVGWIVNAFPATSAPPISGCPSAEPIFIIGLPRSGSTLVERILGSHSRVFPAGEMNHFATALVDAVRFKNASASLRRPELIAASRELDFEALGGEYLVRARAAMSRHANFTDKMPLNYLYCGLIRRALPAARMVHVTRHPMADASWTIGVRACPAQSTSLSTSVSSPIRRTRPDACSRLAGWSGKRSVCETIATPRPRRPRALRRYADPCTMRPLTNGVTTRESFKGCERSLLQQAYPPPNSNSAG